MTRFKFLFAAVVVAAIVGVIPAAHAQTACLGSVNSGNCNVHFVGAGSSAQFNPAAIGADALAGTKLGAFATGSQCVFHWSAKNAGNLVDNRGTVAIPLEPANMWIVWIAALDGSGTGSIASYSITSNVATVVGSGFTYNVGDSITVADSGSVFGGTYTVTANNSSGTSVSFAFTAANVGSTSDGGSINDNTVYSCPFSGGSKLSTGNNSITDIWMDASVDSTVGVRSFLAQISSTLSGVAVETIPTAAGNVLGTGAHNLWPDNASDVSILTGGATNLAAAVGTDQAGIKDVHVNAGLTDIRPEDALFASTRSIAALTATRSGLGYNSTTNVGASILSSEGTGAKATPVKFAITGNDPITKVPIRAYQTFPIGAAPIVFILNHGTATAGNYPTNMNTGLLGTGVANGTGWPTTDATTGKYLAANLFDGSGACAMNNPALTGGGTAALTLFLREPLSGTMNATEYNLFRTTGNVSDSQEQNVVPAGTFNMNPLSAQPCGCGSGSPDAPTCSGPGARSRAIGTGEVVGTSSTGVLGTTNSLGYIFTGFANLSKFGAGAAFNYLTVDGVDPFGFEPSQQPANQGLVNCAGPCAAASYWTGGYSYPTLRNGTYKPWSLYRWVVPVPDGDAYGPTALAQATEDNIDNTTAVADFVPFSTSSHTDGLDVYRSHFTQSAITCSYTGTLAQQLCNGSQTAANALDGGNSLGGGTEAGGDEGGLVIGWDYSTVTTAAPASTCNTTYHATKVTKTAGRTFGQSGTAAGFTAGQPLLLEHLQVTINGVAYTVADLSNSTCANPTATILYVLGFPTTSRGTLQSFSVYIAPTASGTAAGQNGAIGKKN